MARYLTLKVVKHKFGPTKKQTFAGFEIIIVNSWKEARKLANKIGTPFTRIDTHGELKDSMRRFLDLLVKEYPKASGKVLFRKPV